MENTPRSEDTAEGADPHPADESRRQFGKAGLAVGSAVILTVVSRPVLAGYACKSPSGFQSGNVSQHGPGYTCNGRTPGYWQTHYQWPSPYECGNCTSGTQQPGNMCNSVGDWKNDGTKFKDVFSCNGYGHYAGYKNNANPPYAYSLMQVLWMTGQQDSAQLGAHIVAALLNAAMGWTDGVLSVQAVKDIWNEYDATGGYVPTAGATPWTAAEIVDYLESTMS